MLDVFDVRPAAEHQVIGVSPVSSPYRVRIKGSVDLRSLEAGTILKTTGLKYERLFELAAESKDWPSKSVVIPRIQIRQWARGNRVRHWLGTKRINFGQIASQILKPRFLGQVRRRWKENIKPAPVRPARIFKKFRSATNKNWTATRSKSRSRKEKSKPRENNRAIGPQSKFRPDWV